jgi:hypothetical protein
MSPRWNALLWIVTILAAIPFFLPGLLPLTDVPEHAAAMASIAHWNDDAFRIDEHYRMGWSTSQYLLAHIVGGGLTKLVGSALLACKILFIALAVGWVQSCRSLLRAFELDERVAILSAPLFWNRALVVGFLPYVASLPLLFATLAAYVRTTSPKTVVADAEHPRRRQLRFVGLAAAGIVIFYTHASAFTLLAAIVGALSARQAWTNRGAPSAAGILPLVRSAALRVAWLGPAAIFAGVWLGRGKFAVQSASVHDAAEIGTMNPFRSIKLIALYAHDTWTSHLDDWIGVGFWILFLALLVARRRDAHSHHDERLGPPGSLVPFAVAFCVYLATPFRVGSGMLLNVRMAPVLAFFALLGLRPVPGLRGTIPIVLSSLLSLLQCVDNVQQLSKLRRDVVGLEDALATLPKGSRMITLNFSGFDPFAAHFTPWLHVGSYHRAMNGGVASFSFSELTHWSVQYKPESAPPRQGELSWGLRPCLFRNERDGSYFDFVLVRGAINPFKEDPPGPRWKVRTRTEKYVLYEKDRLRPPVPHGETPDEGPCPHPSANANP